MVQPIANGEEKYTPEVILVTGGAGFIASHLVIRLVNTSPHYKVRYSRFGKIGRHERISFSPWWCFAVLLGVTVHIG